ncbi:MAG: hypothetical protein AAFV29_21295, partial [Myxococcota bacterium]
MTAPRSKSAFGSWSLVGLLWMTSALVLIVDPSGAWSATAAGVKANKHDIRRGDTYGQLAERYYGSSFFGLHLRQHNRSAALEPGGTVLLPVRRRVKVRRNQSLRDFAKTHMNAPERAD